MPDLNRDKVLAAVRWLVSAERAFDARAIEFAEAASPGIAALLFEDASNTKIILALIRELANRLQTSDRYIENVKLYLDIIDVLKDKEGGDAT